MTQSETSELKFSKSSEQIMKSGLLDEIKVLISFSLILFRSIKFSVIKFSVWFVG